MYGAQRIGFRHLDTLQVKYTVEGAYRSISALRSSGLSFFINESLALRKGLKLRSATDPGRLEHRISAVYREESRVVSRVIDGLKGEGRMVSPI